VSDHRPVTDPDGGPGPTPYVHPEYEPVDALTLRTSLPPEEVLDRLRGVFGGKARGRLRGTSGFEQGAELNYAALTPVAAALAVVVTLTVLDRRWSTTRADVDRTLSRLTRLLEAESG
jgi:hypothetical protein